MTIVKTRGAEFNRYYSDETLWSGHWHDDVLITVNGEEVEEYEDLPDDAKVTIEAGVVFHEEDNGLADGIEMITHFKRWKKSQTTTTLVLEVDKTQVDELVDMIKKLPGVKKVVN